MLHCVALVRTDVSVESGATFIRVTPILVTLMKALSYSETSILTRATRRNIPEDAIQHSHRRENLESYIALTGWTLYWRRNVSPVKYEMGFYILEDAILHSHRRENLKSDNDIVTYQGGLHEL
jgi:hypothetical protein